MKILFVLENYIPHIGGVEIVFKNLCEGLVKKGHEINIVTHRVKGTKKFEIINGVKIYRVNCFYSRHIFTFFSIPKIISLAKNSDLIHTTTFNAAFPSWFVSKILRKKCILTVHEVWVNKWIEVSDVSKFNAIIFNMLEKMIYLLNFDKYVSVSNSTKKQLLDIGKKEKNCITIYNGVDYELWDDSKFDRRKYRKILNVKDNEFVYMFTGRPGVSKGLEYLIKAIPKIKKDIPNSKFIGIISKDLAYKKRYNYITNLIKELNIENSVKLIDSVKYQELPGFIKAADCVVVPSLAEGFGFAVVEACTIGTPVVASNTTSIPEVISCNHILVKVKDLDAIANGVISVYNKKYKKIELKRFTIEKNIESYLKVYNEVLKK